MFCIYARLLQKAHQQQIFVHVIMPNDFERTATGEVTLKPRRKNPRHIQPMQYMAPELLSRDINANASSDLYSLGAVYYYELTGQAPFSGENPLALSHHLMVDPIRPPIDIDADIPQILSDILVKLSQKQPRARYLSAQGLLSDLQHCLDDWLSFGEIYPFNIGVKDLHSQFLLPNKLYGRSQELATLQSLFNRCRQQDALMCFVQG